MKQKTKQRVLSLAAAGIFAAGALAGCAGPGAGASSAAPVSAPASGAAEPSSAPSEPVKLTLWHSMSDETGTLLNSIIKDFNDGAGKEKSIQVETVFQGSYTDATTKLRAVLQNDQKDQLPDVMQIDATGIVDYQKTPYQYTVTDALKDDPSYKLDDVMQVPLLNWNYGGVQLGMPFSTSTTVLFYNKTMLDKAGVTAAPTTFQEIIDLSKKLPKKNDAGKAVSAFACVPDSPSLANWIGQMPGSGADASYLVDQKNGRAGSATKLVCDQEGTLLTFLTEWKKMYDAKALLNQSKNLSDLFMAQQTALYMGYSSSLTYLLTSIGGKFELGCAYLPRVNDQSNYGATAGGSGMFMFNKDDKARTAAAWELVKYLISADVQAKFSAGTGYFPASKAAYQTETYKAFAQKYPQIEVAVKQVNETKPDMLGITIGPSWDFYMDVQNLSSEMLSKGENPEAAVKKMSDTLNGLLTQYAKSNG